jgi:cytochrome c oxidase subunit 2
VQKWWGVFFGVVLGAIFLLCVVSPFVGWWLPPNVSSYGGDVDNLFYIILGFTAFFFVLTEGILVYAMYRYAHRPGTKVLYIHGNHRLELLWTLVPAALLLFIAFAQISVWDRIKYQSSMPNPDQVVQVTAKQWEWRIRYPAQLPKTPTGKEWAEAPEIDDLHVLNELHTWKGAKVRIWLKTQDVIHSFGLPNLRLMQDALPGKTIPMWFEATDSNVHWTAADRLEEDQEAGKHWEIACKELCGGGHYRMRGRLYVHSESLSPDGHVVVTAKEDYQKWLDYALEQQKSHKPEKTPPVIRLESGGR